MRFEIVEETKGLVKKENALGAEILRNLQVIYDQRIHLTLGYSGMFNFCVQELKMSEATAQRRCDALKLTKFVPDLPTQIEEGTLSLTQVGLVSKFLRDEKKEAGRKFEKEEVEKLVAGIKERSTFYEAKKFLMEQSVLPVQPIADQKKVVSGGRTVLEFEADQEPLDLLEQVKNLHSHKDKKLNDLLKDALIDHLKAKHASYMAEPKHKASPKRVTNAPSLSVKVKATRAIPAHIKRAVWKRDQGRCTYHDDESGRYCHTTHNLQYEHLIPFALGGLHTEANLTLRCRAHNLHAAEIWGLE